MGFQNPANKGVVAKVKDALREIQHASYDICFLDVQLPDANGLELMKIIRNVSQDIRIVIMTALTLDEAQMQSLRDAACQYLPKPSSSTRYRRLSRK